MADVMNQPETAPGMDVVERLNVFIDAETGYECSDHQLCQRGPIRGVACPFCDLHTSPLGETLNGAADAIVALRAKIADETERKSLMAIVEMACNERDEARSQLKEAYEECAGIADAEYNVQARLAVIHRNDGNDDAMDRRNAAARTCSNIAAQIRARSLLGRES